MERTAEILTKVSMDELEEAVQSGALGKESMLLNLFVSKAIQGDIKSIAWLVEMIYGKAKIQSDDSIDGQEVKIIIDSDDARL